MEIIHYKKVYAIRKRIEGKTNDEVMKKVGELINKILPLNFCYILHNKGDDFIRISSLKIEYLEGYYVNIDLVCKTAEGAVEIKKYINKNIK